MSGDFVETFGPVLAWVLRTTVEASLVAALVLVAQRLLRDRVSARWRYNLWLLVVARLLLPAVPGAPYSPFNLVQLPDAARRQPATTAPAAAPVTPRRSTPAPLPATPVPGPAINRVEPATLQFASNPAVAPRPAPAQADAGPDARPARTPTLAVRWPEAESKYGHVLQPAPLDAALATGGPVQVASLWTAPAAQWRDSAATPPPAPRSAGMRPSAAMPATLSSPPAVAPWHRRLNWPAVAAVVWVGGAAFVAARLLWVTLRLAAAVRRMRPVRHPVLSELLAECAQQLRLRRLPEVVEAPDGFGPALVGLLRPRVVLPACVLRGMFRRDEMRLILMHELAHMKRWDVAANWLLAVLGAVHWFNPLLALAFRRMRLDRELACDELVLSAARGESARAYGPTLLKLLQTLSRGNALPGMVGVLEGKTPMIRRFAMIARFDRRHLNRSPLLGAALSALAGGIALTGAVRGQQAPTPAREVAVEVTPGGGADAAGFGIAPAVEGDTGDAGDAARAALEAAREQLNAVSEALRERQQAAQESAAEADRAVADAQREAAERERDGRQAMAEARRGLDEARREVGRREQEIRRELDAAARALAELKAGGRGDDGDEGDEGDDDEAADREQELKSQVVAQEAALAELAAERDEALREAQSQVEQAAAELEAAKAEARSELERAVAERNEAIQEAARAAQEAAAEQAAAVEQLAAAQAALGGVLAPPADPAARPPEPGELPELPPEPIDESPPGVDPAAAPEPAPATDPVRAPEPEALPPAADAPPAAPVAPEGPVAAADPAAPAEIAPPATPASAALPAPQLAPTPEAQPVAGAAPSAALPPVGATAAPSAAIPAGPPASGAAPVNPSTSQTPPTGTLPPTAGGGGGGNGRGGGYPGGGYGGNPGGYGGGYGGAAPAAGTRGGGRGYGGMTPTRPGAAAGGRGGAVAPAAGGFGGGRGMAPGATGAPAGTAQGGAGMGSTPGRGGGRGMGGEMPGMMGPGGGMPGAPSAPGMMPGMGSGGPVPDAGRVEDETSRAADNRARQALRRAVPVGFDNHALDGALDSLGKTAGVDIMPDWNALEAAGVRRDTPVSLRLRQGAPLEQALTWLLRSAGGDELGFAIDHGIIVVTTPARLSRMVVTRAYPVGAHGAGVEALVRESVAPESWREQGGTGSVRFYRSQLFVTATEPTHRQVERLLGLMESHGARPGDAAAGEGGMGMYPGTGGEGANPGVGTYPGMMPGGNNPGPSRRPLGLGGAERQ